MSMPRSRASSCAWKLAATLKATTSASETEASATSLLVTSPAAAASTLTVTSPISSRAFSCRSESASASAEPCTSALMTTFTVLRSTPSSASPVSKIARRLDRRSPSSASASRVLLRPPRASAICRAVASESTTTSVSPASGAVLKPTTCTGTDGPASLMRLPSVSSSARTLPQLAPARNTSPTRSVPRWMSVVPTAPSPRSMRASITAPCAARSGFARRSSSSACSSTFSSRSSRPSRCLAETSAPITSPPYSSISRSYCMSSFFTFCTSAVSLSILL
mmetsp:Transcript_27305/g.44870  ORF Transcript_27305/g.44870 Transcript_27305/m.44870 type:complete len:279 (-) Transcript_27305:978-1814(-)